MEIERRNNKSSNIDLGVSAAKNQPIPFERALPGCPQLSLPATGGLRLISSRFV